VRGVTIAAISLTRCRPIFLALVASLRRWSSLNRGFFAQVLLEDFDLLLEVFNNVLLVAVDPAGQTDQDELILVHTRRVRLYRLCCECFATAYHTKRNETAGFSWNS